MAKLVLMRHGESMGNAWKPAYRNEAMNFLSPLGMVQAELAGEKLNRHGYNFTTMISSGMTRARHTMCVVAQRIQNWQREFINDTRLNEMSLSGHVRDPRDRIESQDDHRRRVIDVFNNLIWPSLQDGDTLCVSHYYTMSVLFTCLNLNPDHIWGNGEHIPNAVPFVYDTDRPGRIEAHNDEESVPQY